MHEFSARVKVFKVSVASHGKGYIHPFLFYLFFAHAVDYTSFIGELWIYH